MKPLAICSSARLRAMSTNFASTEAVRKSEDVSNLQNVAYLLYERARPRMTLQNRARVRIILTKSAGHWFRSEKCFVVSEPSIDVDTTENRPSKVWLRPYPRRRPPWVQQRALGYSLLMNVKATLRAKRMGSVCKRSGGNILKRLRTFLFFEDKTWQGREPPVNARSCVCDSLPV